LIFSLANSAVPLTSGFIAEILALLGAFNLNPFVAFFAAFSIVLVPSFMLNLLHRISYGSFSKYLPNIYPDLSTNEFALFFP
jgi:NADH-quinone oxidoreductase subunit M